MKKTVCLILVLFSWWFLLNSKREYQKQGPFETLKTCEEIRSWAAKTDLLISVSSCWEQKEETEKEGNKKETVPKK